MRAGRDSREEAAGGEDCINRRGGESTRLLAPHSPPCGASRDRGRASASCFFSQCAWSAGLYERSLGSMPFSFIFCTCKIYMYPVAAALGGGGARAGFRGFAGGRF